MGYRLTSMIQDAAGESTGNDLRGIIEYICLTVKDLTGEKELFISLGMKVISETIDEIVLWSGKGPYLILLKQMSQLSRPVNLIQVNENVQLGVSVQSIRSTRQRLQNIGMQVSEVFSGIFNRTEFALVSNSGTGIHFFKKVKKTKSLD